MPVNLSIKNVPDDVADKLRKRAKRNHRSLQGELLLLLEESAAMESIGTKRLSLEEFSRKMEKLDLHTASDSTEIIRHDRDTR